MRVDQIILRGTLAARPTASTLPNGSLYATTDTAVIYVVVAGAWQTFLAAGGGGGAPGGSDKNLQYNNASAFGGIANNATATAKFLKQISSGTPTIEQVADADLATTDVTTNNVDTTKHGFAPKAPNDATKYLDGQGAYTIPTRIPGAVDACRIKNSTNFTLSNNTLTTLTWDTELYDVGGMHSLVTNPARITAQRAGKYLLWIQLIWVGNAAGSRDVHIRLNGATNIAYSAQAPSANAISTLLATVYNLAVNDYIEARAQQDSGGNLDIYATAEYTPHFGAQYVGE